MKEYGLSWKKKLLELFGSFATDPRMLQDFLNYRIFSNLIRTSFCRFLKRKKKKLVRCSNPHLSFYRPLPTRQTDSVISDDGESDE